MQSSSGGPTTANESPTILQTGPNNSSTPTTMPATSSSIKPTPTPSNHSTVPTPGNHSTVPTPGNHSTVPTPGNHSTVPTPGNHSTVPTPGNHSSTPTSKPGNHSSTAPTTNVNPSSVTPTPKGRCFSLAVQKVLIGISVTGNAGVTVSGVNYSYCYPKHFCYCCMCTIYHMFLVLFAVPS